MDVSMGVCLSVVGCGWVERRWICEGGCNGCCGVEERLMGERWIDLKGVVCGFDNLCERA